MALAHQTPEFERHSLNTLEQFKVAIDNAIETKIKNREAKKLKLFDAIRHQIEQAGFGLSVLSELVELEIKSGSEPANTTKQSNDQELLDRDIIRCRCYVFGREYVWSGAGRVPKPFKCFVALGNSFSDTLLPENQWYKKEKEIRRKILLEFKRKADELERIYSRMGYPNHVSVTKLDTRFKEM